MIRYRQWFVYHLVGDYMRRNLGPGFLFKVVISSANGVLFAATVAWPQWIEFLFHVDPDHGSGQLEWLILLVSFAVSLWTAVLARRDWRQAGGHHVTKSGRATG